MWDFNTFISYCLQEIDGLKTLIDECSDDKLMFMMATKELEQAIVEESRLQKLLLKSLVPKDDADDRDCILEVRAGTMTHLEMNI